MRKAVTWLNTCGRSGSADTWGHSSSADTWGCCRGAGSGLESPVTGRITIRTTGGLAMATGGGPGSGLGPDTSHILDHGKMVICPEPEQMIQNDFIPCHCRSELAELPGILIEGEPLKG